MQGQECLKQNTTIRVNTETETADYVIPRQRIRSLYYRNPGTTIMEYIFSMISEDKKNPTKTKSDIHKQHHAEIV